MSQAVENTAKISPVQLIRNQCGGALGSASAGSIEDRQPPTARPATPPGGSCPSVVTPLAPTPFRVSGPEGAE